MWNNNKIAKKLKDDGFYVFKKFFNPNDLKEIKQSLWETLNYIKKNNEKNLVKKYYQIKRYNRKLKGNWYDLSCHNLTLYKTLHSKKVLDFMKSYFKSKVIFSARPSIHVHDSSNDFLLEPHQETNMFSRDGILLWCPIFDTNKNNGGLTIYKNSHKQGFFPHKLKSSTGKKMWTKNYTNIDESIYKKFKKINLEIKAGDAVFMINKMIHTGYPMKNKKKLRITITERYNPLQNIPYLKDENAPIKIPYTVDYNKINLDI